MKTLTFLFLSFSIIFCACNKPQDLQTPNQPSGPFKIKIEILGGLNQVDTIGDELQDSIIIRLSRADTLLKYFEIKFIETSCDIITSKTRWTSEQGITSYAWRLSPSRGIQKLKVLIYDPINDISDSIYVNAEGKAPDSAWLPGDCLPLAQVNNLAQESSGRIYCGLLMNGVPYFSDNDGKTWNPLNSFPSNFTSQKIVINSNDEIYIATEHNGIYYSNDKGVSWQNRSNGIIDTRSLTDFKLLRSGKLMASTYFGGLYITNDKGLNWIPITASILRNDRYAHFCESRTGDLYIISEGKDLWKSTDGGINWSALQNEILHNVHSIFIDDNDDIYLGGESYDQGHILKSTDFGQTWTIMYTTSLPVPSYINVERISKMNGYFYFTVTGYGLVRTKEFNSFDLVFPYASEYLTHSNGTILVANYRTPILYLN